MLPATTRARFSVLLILTLIAAPVYGRHHETGFLNRLVIIAGQTYRYEVFVPADFDPHKPWPVILFLHGVGERGDDGVLETDLGISHAIRLNAANFPFVVVMPQCRKDRHWTDSDMQAQVLAALEKSIKEFHGDRSRLYLTGLSMGGYGTWDMAARYPGKFAAYVPICGGIHGPPGKPEVSVGVAKDPQISDPYAETARRIASTPIWIFHGGADPTVPVEESRKMAQALQAAKANVRYTEYPGVGHDSWDKAYAEPELVPWLLAQKLNR
jgi:predicted peptidase